MRCYICDTIMEDNETLWIMGKALPCSVCREAARQALDEYKIDCVPKDTETPPSDNR